MSQIELLDVGVGKSHGVDESHGSRWNLEPRWWPQSCFEVLRATGKWEVSVTAMVSEAIIPGSLWWECRIYPESSLR